MRYRQKGSCMANCRAFSPKTSSLKCSCRYGIKTFVPAPRTVSPMTVSETTLRTDEEEFVIRITSSKNALRRGHESSSQVILMSPLVNAPLVSSWILTICAGEWRRWEKIQK